MSQTIKVEVKVPIRTRGENILPPSDSVPDSESKSSQSIQVGRKVRSIWVLFENKKMEYRLAMVVRG